MTLWTYLKGLFWWAFKYKKSDDINKVIEQLNKPYKIQAWFNFELHYTKDVNYLDSWQPAERTFERKKGDCEDYAIFAYKCLENTNYAGSILCMYHEDGGHATYLMSDPDKDEYTTIGTFGLKYHKMNNAKTLEEDIAIMLKRWNYDDWTSFKLCYNTGETILSIKRSDLE